MSFLATLWLPLVVSAVVVFVVSAATHMLVPYRVREWSAAPDQAALQRAFAQSTPGLYVFPAPATPSERGQPEWLAAWAKGPSGWLALVPPGPLSMGRNLGLSLGVNLFVSLMAAYLADLTLGPAPATMPILRLVSSVGVLAYGVGPAYEAIWYWRPWRTVVMGLVDALVYGLVMAAIFAWLWPR